MDSIKELYRKLNSSPEGLAQKEANARLLKYGLNSLGTKKHFGLVKMILDQFTDFLVIILIIAGGLSKFLGDGRTATAMFLIVGLNATIGFFQQYRTEKTLQALKNLLPHKSKIMRDGKQTEVLSQFVVPGDIIILQAGDSVPADGTVIEAYGLKVNESSLTGESGHQSKQSVFDIQHPKANLMFMGTTILEGEAKMIVTSTGLKTTFGQIAQKTKETKEELSPLQKKLRDVGRTVAKIAGLIMVAVVIYQLVKNGVFDHKETNIDFFRNIFLFALALAAALVPEGLPATVSVALSIGANRLIKKNALVKKLASVETLGSTNVICTDKTGTLTAGKMSIVSVWEVGDSRQTTLTEFTLSKSQMLLNWVLCQNVRIIDGKLMGDSDEIALYEAVQKKKIDPMPIIKEHERLHEISFSPERKMMSVLVAEGEEISLYTKGNPVLLLEKCEISAKEKKKYLEIIDSMATEGLRVFGFAHRKFKTKPAKMTSALLETNLIFDGLAGIEDDIHPEVPEAIRYCHQAGIRIIMITGDYKVTAISTAKKIGLAPDNNFLVVSGEELAKMSDLELREKLLHPIVFCQTDPAEKLRIVETLQKMGNVVAVTGDGVNDAMALKKADIGIAMGIAGTDVAKEAADMILLDDNFATIVNAIKEGRLIWDNLKKFLFYVFSSNAGEFMTVFIGLIFGLPNPILAVQILSVDLGTDVLPSLALADDPAEKNILVRPVKNENLLGASILWRLLYMGVIMGGGAVLNFWLINGHGPEGTYLYAQATTASFATLVICQIVNAFEVRGKFSSTWKALFGNKYLIWSVFAEIMILIGIVYWAPMQNMLSTKPLSLSQWLPVFGVGLTFLIIEKIRKMFKIENKMVVQKSVIESP